MGNQHNKHNNPTPDKPVLTEDPNSDSNISTPEKPLDLELLSKMMALLGILSYVVGLLTVNMYLYQLGVSDFSLFKPRFVLTGFIVLLLSIAGFICPFLGVWYIYFGNIDRKKIPQVLPTNRSKNFLARYYYNFIFWSREFWGRWLIGLSLISAPWVAFSSIIKAGGNNGPWAIGLILYLFSLSIGILGSAVIYRDRTDDNKVNLKLERFYHTGRAVLYFMLATFCFIFFLALFTQYIFPVLPEQFGGGKPKQIRILFEKDSLTGAQQIGIPIPPNEQISEPLNLLFEGTDSYILRLPNNEVVQIDRKITQGIQIVTN